MTTLYVRDGDAYRAADTHDIIGSAKALIAQRYRTGAPVFSSPDRTREFLTLKLGGLEYEMFAVLALDNRHRLIEYIELFRGTVDNTTIHPREVVKELLRLNAAAAIWYVPLMNCPPRSECRMVSDPPVRCQTAI
jgi:DNA repair protein RadC